MQSGLDCMKCSHSSCGGGNNRRGWDCGSRSSSRNTSGNSNSSGGGGCGKLDCMKNSNVLKAGGLKHVALVCSTLNWLKRAPARNNVLKASGLKHVAVLLTVLQLQVQEPVLE